MCNGGVDEKPTIAPRKKGDEEAGVSALRCVRKTTPHHISRAEESDHIAPTYRIKREPTTPTPVTRPKYLPFGTERMVF